jgi:hypothetical protein
MAAAGFTTVSTFERLGLHQIFVLDIGTAPHRPAVDVTNAAKHIARLLSPTDAEQLMNSLAVDRAGDWQLDVHYSLVRNSRFHSVVGQEPLQAALRAYQDSEAVLIHLIWYWPSTGEPETFSRLWACHWPGPPSDSPGALGHGILITAGQNASPVTSSGGRPARTGEQLAHACLEACEQGPTRLTDVPLTGANLYTSLQYPLGKHDWVTVLLFADTGIENGLMADRWVLDEWPLVVKYTLSLERLYLDRYRSRVQKKLEASSRQVQHALHTTFAPLSNNVDVAAGIAQTTLLTTEDDNTSGDRLVPPVLATNAPRAIEEALRRLAPPQYALLSALGEGEELGHKTRLHLRNLEDHLGRLPMLADSSPQATPNVDILVVASRVQRWSDHIEAGLVEARQDAERAARAVDVLSTHAETIRAMYERVLAVRLAIVGFALATAELFDQGAAKAIYKWWQELSGVANGPEPTDSDVFLVRFGAIALVTLVTWLAPIIFTQIRKL